MSWLDELSSCACCGRDVATCCALQMLGEDLAAAEREQQRERAAKIRGRKAGKRRPTGEPAGPVRRSTRARGNKAGVDG